MGSGLAPYAEIVERHVPAVAAGSDSEQVLHAVALDSNGNGGTVASVTYTPDATLTGANTDSRTVTIYNRKGDGSGTAVVAQLAFVNAVNATQYIPKAITLSGTAANLQVADGDVLTCDSTHVGAGLADPGGLVTVTIDRN